MARNLNDFKPAMAMIAVQCIYAAMAILAKAVFKQGLSPAVFVVYRQAIATLVLVPTTMISRRGSMSMGWRGFCLVFVASLIGVTLSQYFYYQGLHLATSSVATAMTNLLPGITFVMAASIGLEKVTIKSLRSMAKVFGAVICVGGAVFMGFFKGPKLLIMELPTQTPISSIDHQWATGSLFLVGCTCCWSLWLILQVPICKKYLDPLSLSAWTCFLSTCQSAILAFFLVPNLEAWKITSILELLSCLFVVSLCFLGNFWFRCHLLPTIMDHICSGASLLLRVQSTLYCHHDYLIRSFASRRNPYRKLGWCRGGHLWSVHGVVG